MREAHGGGLMGHFGITKTLEVLHEHFYWPNMKRDVQRICDRCIICRQAKSRVMPHRLYIPVFVSKEPWVDISMDFILDLPRYRKGRDFIFVVVDRFSKMTHFIAFYKTDDTTNTADLLFREVFCYMVFLEALYTIETLSFLSYFWKVLWGKLGTKLLYSTTRHPQTNGKLKLLTGL
jgi:hypothetical protein